MSNLPPCPCALQKWCTYTRPTLVRFYTRVCCKPRPTPRWLHAVACCCFLHRVLDYRLYWETVGWVGIVIGLFCCCKRSLLLQPNKIKLHEKEPLLGPPLPKVAGVRRLHKKFFLPRPLLEKNVTTTTDERRRKRRRRKALITVISCCFLAGEEVVAAFSTKI